MKVKPLFHLFTLNSAHSLTRLRQNFLLLKKPIINSYTSFIQVPVEVRFPKDANMFRLKRLSLDYKTLEDLR